jgi:hypothetical protein
VVEQLSQHQAYREGDRNADQGLLPDLPLDRTQALAARRLDIGGDLVHALLQGVDLRLGAALGGALERLHHVRQIFAQSVEIGLDRIDVLAQVTLGHVPLPLLMVAIVTRKPAEFNCAASTFSTLLITREIGAPGKAPEVGVLPDAIGELARPDRVCLLVRMALPPAHAEGASVVAAIKVLTVHGLDASVA